MKFKLWLIGGGLFLFSASPAVAAVYDVNPQTIGSVLKELQPGDTVNAAAGAYAPFTVSRSGTASAPITVKGSGAVVSGGTIGLTLSGSYLEVSGFEVTAAASHGLLITGKHIKLTDFSVHDNVSENIQSDGNCGKLSSGFGSGLSIKLGSEDVRVSRGTLYHNCGEGMTATRTINTTVTKVTSYDNYSGNFYIDNSKDVTLDGNFSYCTNNTKFYRDSKPARSYMVGEEYYSSWGAQLSNATMINNLALGCRGLGFNGSKVSGGLKGGLIAHNTLWGIVPAGSSAVYFASAPQTSNVRIYNNILNGSISLDSSAGITSGNNLASPTFQTAPAINPDSFQLAANSAGINAGAADLGVTGDYYGNIRDSQPDSGAYEYGVVSGASPSPAAKPGDANGDGQVDGVDYSIWLNHYGQAVSGAASGDFNNDNRVDGVDYVIWLTNYGK